MSEKYDYLDNLTDEEVEIFKEEAREESEQGIVLDILRTGGGIEKSQPEIFSTSHELDFLEEGEKAQKKAYEDRLIIAEGDSWFDYLPGTDIIDCLGKFHNYRIENYAKGGDTLENMIYGTKYYKSSYTRKTPTIYKVLRKLGKYKPKVFLFSGGGNDIAGDEFASYLNHKNSGLPNMRIDYIDYIINQVFKKYLEDLIAKVASVSPDTNIIMHGYGHTAATGKGVSLLMFDFAGPWLKPALTMKGILDPIEQNETVEHMINAYNEMLFVLDNTYEQFHYVDLRDHIDAYNDWTNELHLKNSVYARVSDLIAEKIKNIIDEA